jgi:hypothetical protein
LSQNNSGGSAIGEGLEIYRQDPRKFEIRVIGSLLVGEEGAGVSPAKFKRGAASGVEEDWSTSIRSSRRVQGWVWEEERVTGGGFLPVAEVVAEGSSSAGCFLARRAARPWSNSCSRRRGGYWSGWSSRRKGGRTGSTETEAHRRGGSDGEVVPVTGVPEDGEEATGKLLRNDVVLLVLLAKAEGLCGGESMVRPSGGGA